MEKLADISIFTSLVNCSSSLPTLSTFNEDIPSTFSFEWPKESDWYRKEPSAGWDNVERGLLMKIYGNALVDAGENTFNMGIATLREDGVREDEIDSYIDKKVDDLYKNRKLTAQLGLENIVSTKPDDDPFEVYDKAAWHIDGGEDADETVNQLASLFETLHDQGMLSEEGEEMYKSGIDSRASLHSRMVTPEGKKFLESYYKQH